MHCGLLPSWCLGFSGLCQEVLLIFYLDGGMFGKHSYLVWNLVPICLLWTLLTKRNHCDFEDKEALLVKLKLLFIQSIFHWSSVLGLSDAHSIVDFTDSFSFLFIQTMVCFEM